ncbi:aldehyde dehydrogenase family protein [Actinomadura barringtoniae]|uniref:Aldehyde dehydrogenase family protein n=1 Tax=Actinomadura barringtoniae TaxID=1427535 RepID=A0A939T5Q2_9ACTN|nr:aldehyde dehydrogenase family protein [Actinomadura barringtoniae]MBO2454011.1 aldehyde dehydrogenase family protein [Actinomadura barringtoniae]
MGDAQVPSVEVIRPAGDYRSLEREPLTDVTGSLVGALGLAPPLLIRRVLQEMRESPDQPLAERLAALAEGGRLFATATLDGETPEAYCTAQSRVSGVPIRAAHRGLGFIASAAAAMPSILRAQVPRGVKTTMAEAPPGVSAIWTRRGRLLAVLAPGNHPLPHYEWLVAVALGYRVAVRPSRRDPFTPRRLVRALRAAGIDPGHLALLPADHAGAGVLAAEADLALVYGGDEVVRAHAGDPRVAVRGPGRAKTFIGRDVAWRDHLDLLVEAVAADGGVQCLNTTTVLVDGDTGPVAAALDERLRALPDLPPCDHAAALPVQPVKEARRITEAVGGTCTDLGDGSAVLRPLVREVGDGPRPEMPFPCAWVAPWTPGSLNDSLVVTLLTGDTSLVSACLDEPTIRSVHRGPSPTTESQPNGHLAAFLMESTSFRRAS